MDSKRVEQYKKILLKKKETILKNAQKTLSEDTVLDPNELVDDYDFATTEYNHSLILRLRDREKKHLEKIEEALKKIEEGTFGICEDCGKKIEHKRLLARPETTLCIECKIKQEREEKLYEE